jgi:hypothetical protein
MPGFGEGWASQTRTILRSVRERTEVAVDREDNLLGPPNRRAASNHREPHHATIGCTWRLDLHLKETHMQFSHRTFLSQRDSSPVGQSALRARACALAAVGALFVATAAGAASVNPSEIQARYQRERAACMNGESHQDRATCLKEAGAALQEARHGNLVTMDARQYERNRLARCDAHPPEEREDCVRRMHGEGTTTGSVEGGGIYRELVTTVTPSAVK